MQVIMKILFNCGGPDPSNAAFLCFLIKFERERERERERKIRLV